MAYIFLAVLTGLAVGSLQSSPRSQDPPAAQAAAVQANFVPATPLMQGRGRIDYYTPTSVQVFVPASIVMGGFRVFGSYRNGAGRSFPTAVNGSKVVAWPTDLAIESSVKQGNWYSVFAVANDEDDTATFALMPYFTVRSVSGKTVRFGLGGEGQDFDSGTTYAGLEQNEMAGSDVLLVEEDKRFSRRTVRATASTAGSITLDDVGNLSRGDRVLAAPPGYEHFAWVADFYVEAGGEPRNLADMGDWVGSLMSVNMGSVPPGGAVVRPVEIDCRSYISPLASGISIYRAVTLSTASTGNFAEYFWHDASQHAVVERFYNKVTNSSETIAEGPIVIPFSKTQSFFYSTAGTLAAAADARSIQPRGWFIP